MQLGTVFRYKFRAAYTTGPANLCSAVKDAITFKDLKNSIGTLTGEKKRKKHGKPPGHENLSWEERLADAVTPLWRLSYEQQLQLKQQRQQEILHQLFNRLANGTEPRTGAHRAPPLLPIRPSPVRDGYRNKSTFSVNRGAEGNPKTVGYYVGSGKARNIVCVSGDHLLNMPEKHKLVARCYEEFIRLSPLDPCILFHKGGHWREITVRTNSAGDTMLIVFFHPQGMTQNEICVHKAALVEYFIQGPGTICQLDSLYFQETSMTRCSNEQSPYQLLYGASHIYEDVLGFKFRISADAFFQVNTAAAEVLYGAVRDLSAVAEGDTLLDVCCGAGAIGISMASLVERVIGVEVVEQAVEDAKHNATLNHVRNCEFLPGKAEVVLPQLVPLLSPEQGLVAVANPSRAGLHYRVVRALRNHSAIRRLVYVSCKPEGEAMRNFQELCCPTDRQKKLTGEPFIPTTAVPVDMFPHTLHCELVLVFESESQSSVALHSRRVTSTLSVQNDIYEWSRDHRVHHKYSETDADPHNAVRGFFFAHIGWLLVRKHPDVLEKGRKLELGDLKADKVVMFQRKYYKSSVLVMCFGIPMLVPWYLWGESLWVGYFVPGLLRYTVVLNATWLVNSAAHMWGNRPYDRHINPRENKFVAFSAVGEGFHNYHHTFPYDYSTSEFGCKFNLTTFFIDSMCFLGLATDRKKASRELVQARVQRTGDGSTRSG
ncbi:hypothetical protein AAFF_G00139230 [Aldrovandia affinis]|uniref:tRNA (uracil(54)-C(5))-methyltransferase n=1 Tax=Aldrovandia affinis TaxID=143900 RepID=A0AAD7X3V0_9TELE|nr:hypothetical protein AAFF_G00139230 [Aldrovandia affinis]